MARAAAGAADDAARATGPKPKPKPRIRKNAQPAQARDDDDEGRFEVSSPEEPLDMPTPPAAVRPVPAGGDGSSRVSLARL